MIDVFYFHLFNVNSKTYIRDDNCYILLKPKVVCKICIDLLPLRFIRSRITIKVN